MIFENRATEFESYLKKINLDFKVLLLLDNAAGHSKNLNHSNVQVITQFVKKMLKLRLNFINKKKYMKNCVFLRFSEPNPIFCMNFMSRFTRFRFARYFSSP
jgi:hypothetical protein